MLMKKMQAVPPAQKKLVVACVRNHICTYICANVKSNGKRVDGEVRKVEKIFLMIAKAENERTAHEWMKQTNIHCRPTDRKELEKKNTVSE